MAESLETNYARAGYHARQRRGRRPALLLIDFARAYFDPEAPLYGGAGCAAALAAALPLRDAARAAGVPVVLTQVKYAPGGADGGAFFAKVPALSCFEEGRPTAEFAPGLAPGDGDIVITKRYPSAFFGTDLASTLRWLEIDTLLLGGLTTSGCVRASCIDSISHGFITLVVEDAVGDRAEEPHRANLHDMSAKYADLVTSAEAVDYLAATRA